MPPALSPSAIRSPLLRVAPPSEGDTPSKLRLFLDRALDEQHQLTAVDRFSRQHDESQPPAQSRYYRDLIPLERPAPGQQYSFEVDLDVCTGCKACVASCHALNGLDDGEVWRSVGLLHGGTAEVPVHQTVTTACHHCVDPACMSGCPVKAYEKDPVTGIVKHLDDQCIGCQYCTLMCPYDAPKYSASRGIVRKCDMCSDRLAANEAPACVQSCPNEAIRIAIIDQKQAVQASEAGVFLPGAPAPDHTIPTTVYKTARPVPRNLLPADFYSVSPEHGHLPLVVMLVLTQLAVGAFVTNVVKERFLHLGAAMGAVQAAAALALAVVAIGAATLHLGRPQFAFRAVLGFATSWMSREIVAFGLFAGMAALYAASLVPQRIPLPGMATVARLREVWEIAAMSAGGLGVLCSVMIYVATRRSQWGGPATAFKFVGSSVILGAAAALVTDAALGASAPAGALLLEIVVAGSAVKLTLELAVFRHLWSRQHTTMKRVAILMVGALRRATLLRFAAGVLGGIVVPLLLLFIGGPPSLPAGAVMVVLLAIGELCERSLFFRSAPASRMPGAHA